MMKFFIETSILLASLLPAHPNYRRANDLLKRCRDEGSLVCLSTHVIAELYANLSNPRISKSTPINPKQAVDLIRRLVIELETIVLDEQDYYAAMDRCADLGLVSGVMYDALHFQAALKAKADILYTENRRDFDRLLREDAPVVRSLPD